MKIGGVEADRKSAIYGPVVFRRGESYLSFYARPVWSTDDLDRRLREPENKSGRYTKTGWETDPEAPGHLEAMKDYRRKRWAYMVISSLEPSEIEWATVDLANPNTWLDYETELRSVLAESEYGLVLGLVLEANSLDAAKLEENKQSFFQRQGVSVSNQITPNGETGSTSHGGHASVSGSNLGSLTV